MKPEQQRDAGDRIPCSGMAQLLGFQSHLTKQPAMTDARLEPLNWSMTYGPYELHNWQEYSSICDQLCSGSSFYNADADDFMEYTSEQVI